MTVTRVKRLRVLQSIAELLDSLNKDASTISDHTADVRETARGHRRERQCWLPTESQEMRQVANRAGFMRDQARREANFYPGAHWATLLKFVG